MGSTDNETDSSMDDILDSIRQIISEEPIDDEMPAKHARQPGQAGDPAKPGLSEQAPENLTNQLAEALVRETPPKPSGAIPPAPSATAAKTPEAAPPQSPPSPSENIMELTKPLPAGEPPSSVSQPAPPQVSQPAPAPAQMPSQQATPVQLTTPVNHVGSAPVSQPVGQTAGQPQPKQTASQPQTPAANITAPHPSAPQPDATQSDQPAVARLTPAQSTSVVPDEGAPVKATLSDPAIAPVSQPQPNGLDALQQALQGVSSSTPDKSAGPIVDLTPVAKSVEEPRPVETEPVKEATSEPEAIKPDKSIIEDAANDAADAVTREVTEQDVTEQDVTEQDVTGQDVTGQDVSEEVTGNDKAAADEAQAGAISPTERALRDLVKPMIKNWLDDNMPRLVKDSLREELDQPKKSDD